MTLEQKPQAETVRLTALSHGGGCGCKLAPAALREILDGQLAGSGFPQLLVGNAAADDAAVWQLDEPNPDGRCLVATTDFFMPIVDDPQQFGRIAATNALSDIYAMGARPLFALAILGIPLGKVETGVVREIIAGGAAACRDAGIPVAGGHSIDSEELIYGLAVIGEVNRENLKTNGGARDGDVLILTKPLGVGLYSAALKKGALDEDGYRAMIDNTTRLNTIGTALGQMADVHAMTDVTGFGICGHGLEMARASGLTLEAQWNNLPLLPQAASLAQTGFVTGASGRNWASIEGGVRLPADLPAWQRDILTDPQTSGGLLVSVAPEAADQVLALALEHDFKHAAIIGRAVGGAPEFVVRTDK